MPAKHAPDWISTVLSKDGKVSYKPKKYLKDTYLRFIKELKLSKQNELIFKDGKFIYDKALIEIVSTKLLNEGEPFRVELPMAKIKDIAAKITGLIESPIDNRGLIAFKNKTLDFRKTRITGQLEWLPTHTTNHNPVIWNFMTLEEIEKSPKHMEMVKYMTKMFKLWEIDVKVFASIGAYAMCKENFANRIFYFKGEGGRGKSTAIKMILRLFDTTASGQYNPVKQNMGDEVAFVGTQVVYYMDLIDGAQNPIHLKPASTGDPIEIRPLYKQAISHVPYSTMIFGTNFDVNWEGRSGGMSAGEDRAFTLDFRGAKVRGTEIEDEYQKVDPLNNPYFMDVFASLCAHEIPNLLKNKFNDERSRKANSNSLNKNDVINVFLREIEWDNPEPIEIDGRRIEDKRVYSLGRVSENGKLYTTQKELWQYFNAWRDEAKYKYQPNRDEFFKFLSNIVGRTLNSVNIKIIDPKGLKKNRWIDLSIFKGGE